ncbi:MAG: hypothetical protein HDR84_01015 [Bacteroides sp.]|nr:hypothetical protein [Bacteroides sp.]
MKKILLFGIALTSVFLTTGCIQIKKGTLSKEDYGDPVTRVVNVTDTFNAIETFATTDVTYTQGPLKVTLTAPEKKISDIIVKVENGTLKVGLKDENGNGNFINGYMYSKLTVSAPNVQTFTSTGTGDIEIKGLNTKDITLQTYGTGDINLTTGKCTKLVATSTGTGDIDIEYLSCVIGDFNTNGTGDVKVKRLVADKISGVTTGTGDIIVSGECKEANLSSTGVGDVKDKGLEIIKTDE